jgi:hypothetical protein
VEAATHVLAEYLALSIDPGVGNFLDVWRRETQADAVAEETSCQVRGFGLHRLRFPRFSLAARAADLFCKHLIDGWLGQSSGWEEKRADKETLPQIAALGLDAENLSNRLHAAVLRVFGEGAEQTFLKILADFPLEQTSAHGPSTETISAALARIDIFLGSGIDTPGRGRITTPVDRELLREVQKLSDQLGRGLVDWLLTLVEDSDRRLKAAYHAARWSLDHFTQSCKNLRGQLEQLRNQRSLLRDRLAAGQIGKRSSRFRRLTKRGGQRADTSTRQQLIAYCWLRVHESVLENMFELLHAIASRIASFLEELERSTEALRHFGASLAPTSRPARGTNDSAVARCSTELWPGQSKSLEEAASQLFERLASKLCPLMEKSLQSEVLDPHGGLWGLASTTGELADRIKDEFKRKVLSTILDATRDINAAKLWLQSRRDPEEALRDLLACVAWAFPNQEVPKNWQHLVLALPDSPEATILRQLLGPALEEVPNTVLTSQDDIVLCHEAAHVPVQEIAEFLLGDDASLADAAYHVLTRNDIQWSPLGLRHVASVG